MGYFYSSLLLHLGQGSYRGEFCEEVLVLLSSLLPDSFTLGIKEEARPVYFTKDVNFRSYHDCSLEVLVVNAHPFQLHLQFDVLAGYHIYSLYQGPLLRRLLGQQVLQALLVDLQVHPQVLVLLLLQVQLPLQVPHSRLEVLGWRLHSDLRRGGLQDLGSRSSLG